MKSLRKSRSTENRNARKAYVARGHSSLSSAALLAPNMVLGGRAFRRANGLTRAEAAIILPALQPEPGFTGHGRLTFVIDSYAGYVTARNPS